MCLICRENTRNVMFCCAWLKCLEMQGSWLGSGSMAVCKDAEEEMGSMVGLAIMGQWLRCPCWFSGGIAGSGWKVDLHKNEKNGKFWKRHLQKSTQGLVSWNSRFQTYDWALWQTSLYWAQGILQWFPGKLQFSKPTRVRHWNGMTPNLLSIKHCSPSFLEACACIIIEGVGFWACGAYVIH